MPWPDDLTTQLPPERPDEPAHLRQDILDELTDHLDCALTRESRRTEDETTARKAVLARFGNPCSLARQLWFDALKESIMKQRTLLATNLLLAVVCIAVGVIAWTSMQQGKAFQQALLDKLNAAPPANQNETELSIWTHGSFKIVEDTEDGPPAAGYTVTLSGSAFEPGHYVHQEAKTDDEGKITFGPIRPSAYHLKITDPAGLTLSREMVIYPGNKPTRTIVWPKTIETVQKPLHFGNVPEALAKEDLILGCYLTHFLPVRDSHGGEWIGTAQGFLIRSDGYAAPVDAPQGFSSRLGINWKDRSQKLFLRHDSYEYQSGLSLLPEARYELRFGILFARSEDSRDGDDENQFTYDWNRTSFTSREPLPEDQINHTDLDRDYLVIRIPGNKLFEQSFKQATESTPDSEGTNKPNGNTP